MIVVVDYGISNIGSLVNMLKKIGTRALVTSKPEEIGQATRLILPGIGAFDAGMQNLNNLNLVPVLNQKVREEKIPVLGICLGMQLMARCSSEGTLNGLSWLSGEVVRFSFPSSLSPPKVPHMGWNYLALKKQSRLFSGFAPHPKFYFVHSYHFSTQEPDEVLGQTHYGYDFVSAVEKENMAGVQFHPEKSHKFGMQLLKNFVELF